MKNDKALLIIGYHFFLMFYTSEVCHYGKVAVGWDQG